MNLCASVTETKRSDQYHTCRSLGCPLDVEFCCETARLKALIHARTGKFFAGVFSKMKMNIPWDCIRQIGEYHPCRFRGEKTLSGE